MQRTLIKTADGSHSLYVKELDEHYHSIHGAIQESKYVFIEKGLKHILTKQNFSELFILEIGFGTGLNALLTFMEAENLNAKINYTSLEAFPLEIELVNTLNYVEQLSNVPHRKGDAPLDSASDNPDIKNEISNQVRNDGSTEKSHLRNIFNTMHTSKWETVTPFSKNFTLHKIKKILQQVEFNNTFDLIYFDAFGPRVQPEMWEENLFGKIFDAINPQGCLVTYCAKGEVKRTLKKVGFVVETLPGPPGKREMVRGSKN
jgi:tRNA U34 5-methylaminomethyl-2-thiouridine-forming methyltransferase MnmC